MDKIELPKGLSLQGNLADNYKWFLQRFDLYMLATGKTNKPDNQKTALFLTIAGEDALRLYNTFKWEQPDDKEKLVKIKERFEAHCKSNTSQAFLRHQFFKRSQHQGETVDHFVTELKTLAKDCEFGELTESLIRDNIICGVTSDVVRERMLRESKIDLTRAIEICRAAEASKTQIESLSNTGENNNAATAVHKVGVRPKQKKKEAKTQSTIETKKRTCGRCGTSHPPRSCPAYGQTCHKCKKPNHYAKCCRARSGWKATPNTAAIHAASEQMEELFIGPVGTHEETDKHEDKTKDWFVNLKVNHKRLQLKIDTGAQANIISQNTLKQIRRNPQVTNTAVRLINYSGEKIPVVGKCIIKVCHRGISHKLEFVVVESGQNLLGLDAAIKMQLIKRIDNMEKTDITNEYADVFDGTGCFDRCHHIKLDENATPVVHPPRRVPFALRDRLKEELDRLVEHNIVEKVDYPTDWVNSLVIVEKPNGKLRLCLDPKELNQAIRREHYHIPVIEELVSKLDKAQYFSILDANNGFWQVPLDKQSSDLCTFNTPFGRYKFMRLPFGIHSASEVFHKRMSELLENVDGAVCYIDDILVYGKSREEHDARLRQVLEIARAKNIKLNKAKCKIAQTEIQYLGRELSREGIKPDKAKVKAILEMPTPESRKDLERFLGMIQYIGRFIPSLSAMSAPLRILLKKETEWHWEKEQEDAYNKLKNLATSTPTLKYFDVDRPVELSVDASKDGLGAVLTQEGNPVAYASKALTQAEKGYAQIEKEMLAITFGCQKFHQYIYGRHVTVISDHKPLEAITKKPLSTAPPRIQRLLLAVQKYDIKVVHKPGTSKEMIIADTLSRAYLPTEQTGDDKNEIEMQVHMLVSNLPMSDVKRCEFRETTKKDKTLQMVTTTVLNGWPNTKQEVPDEIRPYWDFREEIHVAEELLFKGDKLIVPKALQQEMLNKIHSSHLGINKCKARARDTLYWPGMSKQIEDMCSRCAICLEHRKSNMKEPMIPHTTPERAWSKVGTDLFYLGSRTYLIVVDYYSKFPEIMLLDDTTSKGVITVLKSIFARHGIPDHVISDGGPQYSSNAFREFAHTWQFNHVKSSPGYAQSNGMAERTIQTVKQMLKKANKSNQDPYLSLLEYRNTPIDQHLGSPCQLLMSRRTRSILPTHAKLLQPKVQTDIQQQLINRQTVQKMYHDRNSSKLPNLNIGDTVRVQQKDGTWKPAVVTQKTQEPRSYIVRTPMGELRRNRKHLLKTKEDPPNLEPPDLDHVSHKRSQQLDENPQTVVQQSRSGRMIRQPRRYVEEC